MVIFVAYLNAFCLCSFTFYCKFVPTNSRLFMLKNDTIYLRALEGEDVPFLYAMENDASIWEAGSNIQPFSAHALRDYVASQQSDIYADKQLRLVICLANGNKTVGMVDLYDFSPRHLHAWVAIMVAREHQGRGVARMALDLLADYAFHFLHIRVLMSMVAEDNEPSIKLFGAAGYRQCGLFPSFYLRDSRPVNGLCLCLTKPENLT